MRYAIFSHLYFPHTGGVESFTRSLADALVRSGDDALVVTMRVDDSPEHEIQPNGVEVIRLPCHVKMDGRLPWTKHSSRYKVLFNKALSWKADRILVNTRFFPHSIEGLRYGKALDAPVVLLDHGSAYLTVGSAYLDKILAVYEHAITAIIKYYQPIFAGVSLKSLEWLKTFGIDASAVVPNAIDASVFCSQASQRNFKDELRLDSSTSLVVSVGRLEPEKGSLILERVASVFDGKNVHFAIAGEGSLRSQLTASCPPNFHLLGNLTQDDLSRLLLDADIFCLPSRSEGFCTSLLEASACALPSIVPDFGGARELIPSCDYGWVLPDCETATFVDGLNSALALSRDALLEMGKKDQLLVRQTYNWNHSLSLLRSAYEHSK